MKKILASLFIASALTGCTTRTITYGGATYTSKRFLQKEDVDGLKVTTTNGTTIELVGYRNDQVQAVSAIAEGVTKGLAASVKP